MSADPVSPFPKSKGGSVWARQRPRAGSHAARPGEFREPGFGHLSVPSVEVFRGEFSLCYTGQNHNSRILQQT